MLTVCDNTHKNWTFVWYVIVGALFPHALLKFDPIKSVCERVLKTFLFCSMPRN